MIEVLERVSKLWEEEIRTAGNKTALTSRDLARLNKKIDKAYALESKARIFEEKVLAWTKTVGQER